MFTTRELQDEIIRLKKRKTFVFWHMPIKVMIYGKLQILWEILTVLVSRRRRQIRRRF